MKHILPSFLVLFSSAFLSCGQQTFEEKVQGLYKNTVPLITSEELKEKRDVVLLDVRSPEEYRVSHLKGAMMLEYKNFNKKEISAIDKEAEVIVYCSVGYRSERVGEKLQEMGYTHVKNLYGGIFDWKNQGYEVVNVKGTPTDSVHTYNKAWSKWLIKGIKVYE